MNKLIVKRDEVGLVRRTRDPNIIKIARTITLLPTIIEINFEAN